MKKAKNPARRRSAYGSGRAYASADKTAREIDLEREIDELRRANEILKDALGFFAKDRKL